MELRGQQAESGRGRLAGHDRLTVAVLALVIAGLFAGAAISLLRAETDSEDQLVERFAARADEAARLVAATVESSTPAIANNIPPALGRGPISSGQLSQLYPSANVALYDSRGSVVATTAPGDPSFDETRLGASEHVESALDGEVGLSPALETADGATRIEAAFPVPGGSRVLLFQLDPGEPGSLFEAALTELTRNPPGTGTLSLIDRNGRQIAGEPPIDPEELIGDTATPTTAESADGTFHYRISTVDGTPWVLLAVIDDDVLFDPVDRADWLSVALLFAFALMGSGAVLMTARALRNSERLADANQVLERRNRETQEANRAKDRFLASMSHELRTPLTAIIGFTQLLRDDQVGEVSDEQKQCLDDVLSSSRHLLDLIDEALDVSAADSGRMKIELGNFDAAAATLDAVDSLRPLAEDRGVELDLAGISGVGTITSDPRRYRQIVLNYLSNALKFTPAGGVVKISLASSGNEALLEVADSGIGIPADRQARLFQDFEQVTTPVVPGVRGTGLGLAISRRIAEALGGRVGCESEAGEGSRFWASLPLDSTSEVGAEGPGAQGGGR